MVLKISEKSKLVSVVIPLFNREILIQETLESLYSQTYCNWEAIVVDDGSTDNSFKVVEKEAKNDERVKLFRRNQLPKGAPRCRNIGIDKSNGQYVIFLDSDDKLAPYSIEERLIEFEKYKTYDFLVFKSAFFVNKLGDSDLLWNLFSGEDDLNRFLKGEAVWCISSPIWKREALIKHNQSFFEFAENSQDWEFHINALLKKMSYKKMNSLPDFFVRRNPYQAVNAISSNHWSLKSCLNRIEIIKSLFNSFNLSEKQKSYLFANLNQDFFNIYFSLNLSELRHYGRHVSKAQIFGAFKITMYQIKYLIYFVLAKSTFKKSHYLFYYLKKLKSKNQTSNGYKSKMSKTEYKELTEKLKTT